MSNFKKVYNFIYQNTIYFVLLVLIVIMAAIDPRLISLDCFRDVLFQSATRMIVALGAVFAILTGGADLSAGRMVGLAAVISASLLQAPDYFRPFFPHLTQLPIFVPIIIAVFLCSIFGFINGFIVAKFKVPPFIATLGTMVIIYGINTIYFDMPSNKSQPIGGLRADFTNLGSGFIRLGNFSIPLIIIIAIIITLLMWILLNKTSFGKNAYAIGSNINAARVSGINVAKTLILMYTIAGVLYGIAGVLEAARTGGATSNYGNGYDMDAIAACVVGGVSTTGGIGTVQGIVAGVLIFGVINYGLTFIGINPYWQMILKGVIVASAVAVDIRKYVSKK